MILTKSAGTLSGEEFLSGLNRSLVSWVVYDIANTAFYLGVVGLFLPLWINQRRGTTDADLGFPIALSMLIVLLISPFLGALTDQLKSRIKTFTLLNILAACSIFLIGWSDNIHVGLSFFCIAFVSVYLAELIYNALLVDTSTEENRGRIGGIATGLGYLGALVAISAAILYKGGDQTSYSLEFQFIAGIFIITALPITFLFIERRFSNNTYSVQNSVFKSTWIQIVHTWDYFQQYPNLKRFFIARYFYMVAVTTASSFAVMYGIKTIGFTETQVKVIMLSGTVISIPSAILWGFIVDKIGSALALKWNLLSWSAVLTCAFVIPWLDLNTILWWPLAVITGLTFGGLWIADRPLLIQLSPANIGEMFGLYGTVSRLAFLTGAFAWPLIAVTWNPMGLGQIPAVMFLVICAVTGLLLLLTIKKPAN